MGKAANPEKSNLPPGLSAPAQRALSGAGIHSLEQLAGWSEQEVKRLHGIGPRALDLLRPALRERGLSFAVDKGSKKPG